MAIGPIELHGMITRQNDVQQVKVNQEQKPLIDHMNQQVEVEKKVENKSKQVLQKDDAELQKDSEGKNEYAGDGGRNRKKPKEGIVVKKGVSSFDIRI